MSVIWSWYTPAGSKVEHHGAEAAHPRQQGAHRATALRPAKVHAEDIGQDAIKRPDPV